MRRRRAAALGAAVLLGSCLAVVVAPAADAALCDRTWDHDAGTTESWFDALRWNPTGTPIPGEVVCLTTTDIVIIEGAAHAGEVHLGGSTTLDVPEDSGLFVDGANDSVWGPGTSVMVTKGRLGGGGTIRAQGDITFTSGDFASVLSPALTSAATAGGGDPPPADTGDLVVEGQATVDNLGLGLLTGYHVTVAAGGTFSLAPDAFVAADYGTGLTIQPGGLLDLTDDGGYYRGFAVTGQPLSTLTNNGLLTKTGGSAASVVDATYTGGGQVTVLSGTLALPDNQQVGASVSPGRSLATGRCDTLAAGCQPSTDPATDAMSVAFTVPATNAGPAAVQLQELGPVGSAVDPAAVGNQVLAHADNLAIAGQPARIDLRFSQADVMATPLAEVQVVHTTDDGFDVVLPDCANAALPAGLWSCVLRPATRTADNTFVSVLTTTTSRWRVRRSQTVENQGAATAPQGLTVKEAAPFDGSAWQVSWSAPASSGAGPVSSYAVGLDDHLVATKAGSPVVLKNPGPGQHTISVAALSAAGQGTLAQATVTVAALSKPRKVTDVRGPAGGKLTAGAKWKAPSEAGGLAITRYQVAAFTKAGAKVDTQKVNAAKLRYLFTLKPGRYFFKVRARNSDRWGPWSKPTDVVRPR